jgi:hypothetical protein
MDVPTYQELLAEIYDESAKNILAHQQEEYDDDEVGPDDHHPDELEHQEDFKKFQGSRQIVEVQTNNPTYTDKTKFSVTYDRDVQTRVINIDSRFKTVPNEVLATEQSIAKLTTSSTNFLYKLVNPVKNVISVRLSSIEIPNTYYDFSDLKGNTSMRILYPSGQTTTYYDISITEGNYIVDATSNTISNNLMIELEDKLNANSLGLSFQVDYNFITSKVTILETTNKVFDIDFVTTSRFRTRENDWGLGYNLGFNKTGYTGQFLYTGAKIVNAIGSNYLFLQLDPDWKVIVHRNTNTSEVSAFAKILVDVPKNAVIYDNGANTVTKEYWLTKPTTVRSFQIKLTDLYGNIVDLSGEDMSLTVELKEVMNTSLYNHYVDQQQPTLGV